VVINFQHCRWLYIVPEPQKDLEGYTKAIRAIAKKKNIDFVPVAIFAVSYYDPTTNQCYQAVVRFSTSMLI